jgi:hypothetical protein
MFAHSKPFQPSLMFVGKAGSSPIIRTPEMSLFRVGCGLTHKLGPALKSLHGRTTLAYYKKL